MTSFDFGLDPKEEVVADFFHKVFMELHHAGEEARSRGLTQQELSERTGFDKTSLSRFFRGESNITIRSLALLAHGLGYRPEFALTEPATEAVAKQEAVAPMTVTTLPKFRFATPSLHHVHITKAALDSFLNLPAIKNKKQIHERRANWQHFYPEHDTGHLVISINDHLRPTFALNLREFIDTIDLYDSSADSSMDDDQPTPASSSVEYQRGLPTEFLKFAR